MANCSRFVSAVRGLPICPGLLVVKAVLITLVTTGCVTSERSEYQRHLTAAIAPSLQNDDAMGGARTTTEPFTASLAVVETNR